MFKCDKGVRSHEAACVLNQLNVTALFFRISASRKLLFFLTLPLNFSF